MAKIKCADISYAKKSCTKISQSTVTHDTTHTEVGGALEFPPPPLQRNLEIGYGYYTVSSRKYVPLQQTPSPLFNPQVLS